MGPCAAVAGVVPVIDARGCACRNDTPCCPGFVSVVTTLLVNAATSGVGRSSEGPVYAGPAWGNTGARAAMEITEGFQGTPRGRLFAGSKSVSCSRELNNCLISSSEGHILR